MDRLSDPQPDSASSILGSILLELGHEIRKPLGLLQQAIVSLVEDPNQSLSESERTHASTMILLCQEIDGLTGQLLTPSDFQA